MNTDTKGIVSVAVIGIVTASCVWGIIWLALHDKAIPPVLAAIPSFALGYIIPSPNQSGAKP